MVVVIVKVVVSMVIAILVYTVLEVSLQDIVTVDVLMVHHVLISVVSLIEELLLGIDLVVITVNETFMVDWCLMVVMVLTSDVHRCRDVDISVILCLLE